MYKDPRTSSIDLSSLSPEVIERYHARAHAMRAEAIVAFAIAAGRLCRRLLADVCARQQASPRRSSGVTPH